MTLQMIWKELWRFLCTPPCYRKNVSMPPPHYRVNIDVTWRLVETVVAVQKWIFNNGRTQFLFPFKNGYSIMDSHNSPNRFINSNKCSKMQNYWSCFLDQKDAMHVELKWKLVQTAIADLHSMTGSADLLNRWKPTPQVCLS